MLHRGILWPSVFVLAALASCECLSGASTYAFAFGMSVDNVVVPGTLVTMRAGLKNLGDAPIVFTDPRTMPPRISAGFALGNGPWDPISTLEWGPSRSEEVFHDQFDGVTINPGETFTFILGTFYAPDDQPMGAVGRPSQVTFGVGYTNTILGSLLGFASGLSDEYRSFDNAAHPTYTLGTTASSAEFTFFQGIVYDYVTGEIFSAPPAPVPEPSTTALFGGGLASFALGAVSARFKKRSLKANASVT